MNEIPMFNPSLVLNVLTSSAPSRLNELPSSNGIYALHDHCGHIRYIGVTGKNEKGFRGRVANRHVTGSEGYSHKFSQAYNTGRMFRSRIEHPRQNKLDAKMSKDLRTLFIRRYCRATFFVVENPGVQPLRFDSLTALETLVQAAAPRSMRSWEGNTFRPLDEPTHLVDQLLEELGWLPEMRQAVDRQAALFAADSRVRA
jgi:hypothetical protein